MQISLGKFNVEFDKKKAKPVTCNKCGDKIYFAQTLKNYKWIPIQKLNKKWVCHFNFCSPAFKRGYAPKTPFRNAKDMLYAFSNARQQN